MVLRCARLLLLLGAGLLAGLLLGEGAVRLLAPQSLLHDPDAFDSDPLLGGRLRAGFSDRFDSPEYTTRWEVNDRGHRGPAAARPRAGPRVVTLGDSFTFGYGVEEEESWPRVLEGLLARSPGGPVEVVNLGIGGYGTVQEVAWLEEHLAEGLDPDLVVVGFYPGNDLGDSVRGRAARRRAREREPGAAAAPPPLSGAQRLKRWLGSTFHLYSLVSERADGLLLRLGLRRVVYPEEVDVLRVPEPPPVTEGWEAVASALASLASRARRDEFGLLLVVIPMRHQVVESSWERVRSFYGRAHGEDLSRVDLDVTRKRVAAICRDEGIPVIDLVPLFRGHDDPAHLYFARDQHWSVPGHAEAAGALASHLEGASWGSGPR